MLNKISLLCALVASQTIWSQTWTITKVADQTTPRPDNQGNFNPWVEFPAIEGQWVVFIDGGTGNNDQSVWSANIATTPPTFVKLADTNTTVPGGAGKFLGFTQGVSNNLQVHNGTVLFFGYDAGSNPNDPNCSGGVYTVPVSGGKISLVVNYNSTLPGNGLTYCSLTSLSTLGMSIDHGEVVFSGLTYNPNTYANEGIWSAPATAAGKGAKLIADSTTVWQSDFPTGCTADTCWSVNSWFSGFISGNTTAFIGGGGPTGADGIFVNSYTHPILQSPYILPGDGSHNMSFPYDASYFTGVVVDGNSIFFSAQDPEYAGTCASGHFAGVFLTGLGGGAATSVMNTCNTLASGDAPSLNSFNSFAADQSTAVFQVTGQTSGASLIYSSVNGVLSPVISTGDPLPSGTAPVTALLAQGGVGTDAINGGRVVFEAEGGALWYYDGLYVASLACAASDTTAVSIALGPLSYNASTRMWSQTATVTNSGKRALAGPLSLVLAHLPGDVSMTNGNGDTVCFAPAASPYVNLPLPAGNKLLPGKNVNVTLDFTAPSASQITFKSELAGPGAR